MTRGLHLVAALVASACASAGAPGGDVAVGVFAVDSEGREGAVDCVVLPVLGGGRVLSRVIVDDAFAVSADATRDEVLLRFERVPDGEALAQPHQLSRALLAEGHSEELVIATGQSGPYTVRLSSGCLE